MLYIAYYQCAPVISNLLATLSDARTGAFEMRLALTSIGAAAPAIVRHASHWRRQSIAMRHFDRERDLLINSI